MVILTSFDCIAVINTTTKGNYPELKQEMRAMGMDYNPFMDTRGNELTWIVFILSY